MRKCEVLDLDYNRLLNRDWIRTDSTKGEFHVIPLEDIRHQVVAVGEKDGMIRVFVDPSLGLPVVDISEIRVGARVYKIRWATPTELHTEAMRNGLLDDESERSPSAMVVHQEQVILLSDALKLMPLRALETLFHECVHIQEDVLGVGAEGGWPEGLIDALAIQQVNMLIQSGFIDLERISIAGVSLAKCKKEEGE
jgi:hypothetical protein